MRDDFGKYSVGCLIMRGIVFRCRGELLGKVFRSRGFIEVLGMKNLN